MLSRNCAETGELGRSGALTLRGTCVKHLTVGVHRGSEGTRTLRSSVRGVARGSGGTPFVAGGLGSRDEPGFKSWLHRFPAITLGE